MSFLGDGAVVRKIDVVCMCGVICSNSRIVCMNWEVCMSMCMCELGRAGRHHNIMVLAR